MANGQTLGAGGFTPPTKPPAPQLADDDPRKMAQDLADIQGNLSIKINQIFRAAKRDPALAANLRGATITLMRELAKTRDLRKDALSLAGLPTAKADIDFERVAARIPEIPLITETIKDEERVVGGLKGQPPEVLIPAVRTIPQGAVESTGGIAGVRGQPAPGPAVRARAVFDTNTKQPRFASDQEILQSNGLLQPLPSGMELTSDGKGGFTIITGTRTRGEGKEGKSREQLVSIQNMARRALGLIDMVEKGGADVLATSGFLSQLKSGFDAQAKSIANKFGLSLNTESFDFPGLSEDAVNARLIKSAVLDLAIMKAQAIGLGSGRALSDKDIQQQINTLSGGFGDPNVVIANIKQATTNVALDFQQRRRILFDEPTFDIRSNLGPGSEVFFDEQEASVPQDITEIALTDEQKTSMKIPLDRDIVIQQGESRFLVKPNAQ